MKSVRTSHLNAPTGYTGFDEITGDGLLRVRAALVFSGPGSGKMKIDTGIRHGSGGTDCVRKE